MMMRAGKYELLTKSSMSWSSLLMVVVAVEIGATTFIDRLSALNFIASIA